MWALVNITKMNSIVNVEGSDPNSISLKTNTHEWKRKFLSVVEGGNLVDELQECFTSLGSLDSRLRVEDPNAAWSITKQIAENRGNFILETLHNGHEKCVLELLDNQDPDMTSLKNQGYFTSHFLQDFEAVRCMVKNHCTFGEPEICSRQKDGEDELDQTLTTLNRYMALVNPIYISACFLEKPESVPDPVYRSCELSKELKEVAERYYEFTNEYSALRKRCSEFGVAVLEECRKMEPDIRCVLETGKGKIRNKLDILYLAIVNEDKTVSPCFVKCIFT